MISKENTIILPTKLTQEETDELQDCGVQGHLLDVMRYFRQVMNKDNSKEAIVADIGCRDDATRPYFKRKGYGWFGIDIDPVMTAVLKGDMHALPMCDETIDLVFSIHALEHSETPIKVLREFKRVTRLGGYVFIATPAYSDYQLFICDKEHIMVPTMKQMKRWCQQVGLEIVYQTYVRNEEFEDRLASLITLCKVVNK